MDGLSVLRGVRDERNDRGRCPHVLLGRLWSLRRDGRLLGCVHRGSPRCPAIHQELQKRIYLWNEVYILSLYRVSGFGQVVPGFLWRWRIFYLWLFRRKVKPSGSIEKQYLIFSDTQIRKQLPWGICNGFPFFAAYKWCWCGHAVTFSKPCTLFSEKLLSSSWSAVPYRSQLISPFWCKPSSIEKTLCGGRNPKCNWTRERTWFST